MGNNVRGGKDKKLGGDGGEGVAASRRGVLVAEWRKRGSRGVLVAEWRSRGSRGVFVD